MTTEPSSDSSDTKSGGGGDPASISAKKLPRVFLKQYELALSYDRTAYAISPLRGGPIALGVMSRACGRALRKVAHSVNPNAFVNRDDIKEIQEHLLARAETQDARRDIWLQVAAINGGIEIDLGDKESSRVQILPGKVVFPTAPTETVFRRSESQLPYPIPCEPYDYRRFFKYVNMGEEHKWLLLGWLTFTLALPKKQASSYVILALQGSRGCGKSTLCDVVLSPLLSPNTVRTRAFPSKAEDVFIAAKNAHVLFFDNVRKLSPSMSDLLCIAATGGALASRKLWSDDDEFIHHLHVGSVLNGIHSFVEEADLAQRCLVLNVRKDPNAENQSKSALVDAFCADAPHIFGGLLDLTAKIMAILPEVTVIHDERMVDFVRWLAALEQVADLPRGQLQNAYHRNLLESASDNLSGNILAMTVLAVARNLPSEGWSGTPSELLSALNAAAGPDAPTTPGWPKNPSALSLRLLDLTEPLSAAGVALEQGRRGKTRSWHLRYTGLNT